MILLNGTTLFVPLRASSALTGAPTFGLGQSLRELGILPRSATVIY
jgi:hypothetical protein